jgi:hypothetical protein
MAHKLLYKEELDAIFKTDLKKSPEFGRSKKLKNNNQLKNQKLSSENALYSEKFSNRRAKSINDGFVLPKLVLDS